MNRVVKNQQTWYNKIPISEASKIKRKKKKEKNLRPRCGNEQMRNRPEYYCNHCKFKHNHWQTTDPK
jgi:lipopolysaccharide biosynthesis regulator YciM